MLEKVIKSAKLISLPEIYIKLKELLDRGKYDMAEIALLVGRDPGIATRFMQVVNSPLNRRLRTIETINQAVALLGVNQTHDIVLSVSVAKTFDKIKSDIMDMEKFTQQSYNCAIMAKLLAFECDKDKQDRDRLSAMGLLHNIGHLAMYTAIPEESQRALLMAGDQKRPLYLVERELLGFDYAEVGIHMAIHWGLPESYQTVIGYHPEPSKADRFAAETALIHISHLLVWSDMEKGVFGEAPYSVDPGAWAASGLTAEKCISVQAEAPRHFKTARDNF